MSIKVMNFAEVRSTQDTAAEHLEKLLGNGEDIPLFFAVNADHQTKGRGRLGRSWKAEPGQALLLTIAVNVDKWKVAVPAEIYTWLPLIAARLLVQAVKENTRNSGINLNIGVKWPNDILIDHQKVGGILLTKPLLEHNVILIGLGLNVVQQVMPWQKATSLRIKLRGNKTVLTSRDDFCRLKENIKVSYLRLWEETVRWFDRLLSAMKTAEFLETVHDFVLETMISIGKYVEVHLPDGSINEGQACRLDSDGALVIRKVPEKEEVVRQKNSTVRNSITAHHNVVSYSVEEQTSEIAEEVRVVASDIIHARHRL